MLKVLKILGLLAVAALFVDFAFVAHSVGHGAAQSIGTFTFAAAAALVSIVTASAVRS